MDIQMWFNLNFFFNPSTTFINYYKLKVQLQLLSSVWVMDWIQYLSVPGPL